MPDTAQQFIDQSRAYLCAEYLPRIRACVQRLEADDVWWRPHAATNSIGHLLLHLAGNVRQWIASGVGGAQDVRKRGEEFEPDEMPSPAELLEGLERAVVEADDVLSRLDPATLGRVCQIQGRDVTALQAIYHAVEHFSMHTGQIIYLTKMRTGADLGFFVVEDGIPRARWEGRPSNR